MFYFRSMEDIPSIKPKYEWLPTYPHIKNDFCGWDGDIRFGRIMKHFQFDWWHWHLNGIGLGSANGQRDTARECAVALEAEYDRIKAILIEQGRFDRITRIPRDA